MLISGIGRVNVDITFSSKPSASIFTYLTGRNSASISASVVAGTDISGHLEK
jgi:hypothetical protein